jgi:hypothetical protein
MLKRIAWAGLGGGLIAGVFLFGVTMVLKDLSPAENKYGALFGYASMFLGFSLIFVAVKQQRDVAQGGVIRFLPALAMGLGITLIAGVIYVLAWEVTLATTGMDFAGTYGDAMIEAARAKGVSGEELAAVETRTRKFVDMYRNPLFRMPITLTEIVPPGLLVSLVSASLLSNSRFLPARANA